MRSLLTLPPSGVYWTEIDGVKLTGYASTTTYKTLSKAKTACKAKSTCNGITYQKAKTYRINTGDKPVYASGMKVRGEVSWVKACSQNWNFKAFLGNQTAVTRVAIINTCLLNLIRLRLGLWAPGFWIVSYLN